MGTTFVHFINFPEDYDLVGTSLPKQYPTPEKCGHIAGASHAMTTGIVLNMIPSLAMESGKIGALKASKTKATHPTEEYIAECKHEWELYIQKFKSWGMIDDRPEP